MELTPELATWLGMEFESMPSTRLQLLDAAAEAFTRNGFDTTTIDNIAKMLGVTKGSVYYYYRSKVDLFFEVHKRAMIMNLKAQISTVVDRSLDPVQRLHLMSVRHTFLMMDAFYYQRVTVQGVEWHQSVRSTPREREALREVIAMRDTYEMMFRKTIQEGIVAGLFANVDSSLAAKGILGMLNWITVWYRPTECESVDFKENVANQLATQAVLGLQQRTAQYGELPSKN